MADQTFYYELPNGALQERVTTEAAPVHPEGATLLTVDEFNAKKAAAEVAFAQQRADVEAAETAQKKAAYDALVSANFDPAVAQTLSGYIPSTMEVN